MGRYVLLTLALFGATACVIEEGPVTDPTGHDDLTCTACHQGERMGGDIAAVRNSTCSTADCHLLDDPRMVTVGSAEFEHRGHASTGDIALGCAGCHTHDAGDQELWTEEESCALCHRDEMSGESGADCKTCHVDDPRGFASQGVEVPHEGISWIANQCVRCHFDVSEAEKEVANSRCADCHEAPESVLPGLGDDLHPAHEGVTCTSCHEGEAHRILAMSSAVSLRCSDCHLESHDLTLAQEPFPATVCNACHGTEHQSQQRMVLGLVEHDLPRTGSAKFMEGLTCRSCHVRTGDGTDPIRGSEAGCVGCHRSEYDVVLDWWRDELSLRSERVAGYIDAASATLPATHDSIAGHLTAAYDLLSTLRTASGVHNLPLAHRMLEGALASTRTAYALGGRRAPTSPVLGGTPTMGRCSYCHYGSDYVPGTLGVDTLFHREIGGAR